MTTSVLNSSLACQLNTAVDRSQDMIPVKPVVFHQREWLKVPCYLIGGCLAKIYAFVVKLFTSTLFFLSEETKKPLYRHIKKVSLQGDYWINHKMVNIIMRHKFQEHFIQKTYNRGQLDILLDEKDLKVAKQLYDETHEECKTAIKKLVKKDVLMGHSSDSLFSFRIGDPGTLAKLMEKMYEEDVAVEEIKPIRNEQEDAEFLQSRSAEIERHILSVSQELCPLMEINNFKSGLKGVCGMAVIHAAYEHFHEKKSWIEIATAMSEGVNEMISGAGAIQTTFGYSYSAKEILFHKLNIGSTTLDTIEFPSRIPNELSCDKLAQLPNATYFLSLQLGHNAHAILFNRENEKVHILDPNFGLFSCPQHEAKALLANVLSLYPVKKVIISQLEIMEYTDNQIMAYWDDMVNGNVEWNGNGYQFLG